MNKTLTNLIILSVLLFVKYSFSDEFNLLSDLELQIRTYKEEIKYIESVINNNNNLLINYKKDLKEYISQLNQLAKLLEGSEVTDLKDESKLIVQELELAEQREKLERIKNSYKQKIITLYKQGADYPIQILFSSESIPQLYTRLEYLQRLSQLRLSEFEKIKTESFILQEKKKLYKLSSKDREKYLSEKKNYQKLILASKIQTESIIDSLNYLNEVLFRRIENINNHIKQIETKKQNITQELRFIVNHIPNYSGQPFSSLKGKLISPVTSVYITQDFGKTYNEQTRAISYNNGIDFSIAKGSEVYCVADGIVFKIFFIPEFGNVIIIKHDYQYFTVYAVVEKISVAENEKVEAGKVIAKTSQNNIGQIFHFEIWENKQPVDPTEWIEW
ncbi:MAG: peptidoglycan DD-metalloendopeptidase family protein [Ignavibacteria bacterium]|nr:peptidoglycan DD-metalloendopeptidase family protein [Ignavibacteria bacterium]